MSKMDALLERNQKFSASEVWRNAPRLPFLPFKNLYVITGIDPQRDPAVFLAFSSPTRSWRAPATTKRCSPSYPPPTVRADVERVLTAPEISPHITVSGHVYDVNTGLLTRVVEPILRQHPGSRQLSDGRFRRKPGRKGRRARRPFRRIH